MDSHPRSHRRPRPCPLQLHAQAHRLETLEPRVLLAAAYAIEAVPEAFDLDRFIREIAAPAGIGAGQNFGARLASMGDLDGDGTPDLAISAPGVRPEGLDGVWTGGAGGVFLYSGRTLELIRGLDDGFAGFGAAMVNMGDLNGDGVDDLAVGSPNFTSDAGGGAEGAGRVWLFSGADGAVIRTLDGQGAGAQLGWSIANVTDVNGDGVSDLIAGAPGGGDDGAGRAFVFSGADGAVLFTFSGENAGDRFGHAVGGGVDVPTEEGEDQGDGFKEFIVGAPSHDGEGADSGRAYVFSGADGSVRFTFSGENAGDEFGSAVAIVGDRPEINRDFNLRFAVGAPGFDAFVPPFGSEPVTTPDTGRVYRFNVIFGSDDSFSQPQAIGFEAGARFGTEIFLTGITSNGIGDLGGELWGVTAPGSPTRPLVVYPNNITNAFNLVEGTPAAMAGLAIGAGDTTGTGNLDFAAAFPDAGAGGAGVVRFIPYALVHFRPTITAASEDGQRFVLRSTQPAENGVHQGYLVSGDQITPYAQIPGLLPGDRVLAVNDVGLLFGIIGTPEPGFGDPPSPAASYFFLFEGSRVSLADAITATVGPAPGTLSFVRLGNNGDVLLNGFDGGPSRAYLFRAGTLTHLWDGNVSDVNDAGVVVGTRHDSVPRPLAGRVLGTGMMRRADGSIVELDGLVLADAINDSGLVMGQSADDRLATWMSGDVTPVSDPGLVPANATSISWTVHHLADDGRALVRLGYVTPFQGRPPSVFPSFELLFQPGVGLRLIDDVIVGETGQPVAFVPFLITDTDRLVSPGALLVPADPPSGPIDGTVAPGSFGSAAAAAGGVYIAAVNSDGQPILIRRSADLAQGQVLPALDFSGTPLVYEDFVTYTDARDGRVYAVGREVGTGNLGWFGEVADGLFDRLGILPPPVGGIAAQHPLTVFAMHDGTPLIAAISASGDVLLFSQTGSSRPGTSAWTLANLSEDLRAQDLDTPEFTGELAGFSTRWGAMNLVGLDAAGEIQTIWWAPGMPRWTLSNLSDSAGTPALSGRLVAYVTTWDALTVAGTEAATGDLVTTWWVPQFGAQWAVSSLTEAAGTDVRLDGDSITAYVTDWGGLNIAGVDADTGEVSVYWWTPADPVWRAEALDIATPEGQPATLAPEGRLVSVSQPGTLNILGRTSDSELVRLFWDIGDGSTWTVEDLSELVS